MIKHSLLLLMCVSSAASSHAQRMICDETCKEEFQHPAGEVDSISVAAVGNMNYAVVSPVGRSTVKMIDMAPRLSTLEGKTIAVVGGSFMASITHPEIKKLIKENFPTAKVLLLDEIGSAGGYIASRRPLKESVFANYYANPGSNPEEKHPVNHWRGYISRSENAESTAPPAWYDTDAETMMTIPTMKKGMTVFLITGDDSRNKIQTMPGGGYATVRIELPRDWAALTGNLGYNPIEEYFIK